MDSWELIEQARARAGKTSAWPSGMQVGQALTNLLRDLAPQEILEFDRWVRGEAHRADKWELRAACFLISGYLAEDGFAEFRYGLVALGYDDFEAVIKDPDEGLASLPVVQAMADGHASHFTLHGGQVESAAQEAYGERYWDDRHRIEQIELPESIDEAAIHRKMPELWKLFPRSAHARG